MLPLPAVLAPAGDVGRVGGRVGGPVGGRAGGPSIMSSPSDANGSDPSMSASKRKNINSRVKKQGKKGEVVLKDFNLSPAENLRQNCTHGTKCE